MLETIYTVLGKRKYFFIFLFSSTIFFLIYSFLPIYLTPGNSLSFFLQITSMWQISLLVVLAFLMGLTVTMQFYIKDELKLKTDKVKIVSSGIFTSFSSIISGIFSTATCSICVGTIFGILGLGSSFVLLLIQYQWELVLVGFLFALLSVYYSIKKISTKICINCNIGDKIGRTR